MRAIKFRAWDADEKCMVSPDYITRDGRAHWKCHSITESTDKVMQYTGLKDKNGKEIYEGDIVTESSTKYPLEVVEWDNNYANFSPFNWGDYSIHPSYCEVIGNIYENPGLLEKK